MSWRGNQSLFAILQALPKGLAACADFSATPLAQNGVYFPWTDMDYQLAPGCGKQDRQKSPYGDHGGQSATAALRPRHRSQGEYGGKCGHWLLTAMRR